MKSIATGLCALILMLGAGAASAAAAMKPSVETTPIADLIANPATKAVLAKDLPKLLSYEGLDMIKGWTLRAISKYPQANLDDAKLAAIQSDLDAAVKPGS
ncbi:MAG TPA: hypothetical protein VG939_03560 [Caulobacteraceae bacterium]|nr:hypothetical protein [Caulobacteraceae bacterium]